MNLTRAKVLFPWLRAGLVITVMTAGWLGFGLFPARPAAGQIYNEPPTPLGGQTAAPLNTSGSTQRKAGSLIIGSSTSPSSFCLNTDIVVNNDFNRCIASWGELGNLTGNYVLVRTNDWNVDPPGPDPPGPSAAQIGYSRIQASALNNQLWTVIAEASGLPSSTGVYATDGGNPLSWAGYFSGRLAVANLTGPDYEACRTGADPTKCKKLCLNEIDDDISNGIGCIDKWSDISAPFSNSYVLLQNVPGPLTVQTGGEALTGAGVFGTLSTTTGGIVLGVPPPTAAICRTCGDGICQVDGAPPDETSVNCPAGALVPGCPNIPHPASVPPGPGGDC